MTCVAVAGNYAYAGTALSGVIAVFDISDPANPAYVASGSVGAELWFFSIAVEGNVAFLGECAEMYLVDITNPLDPVLISYCQLTQQIYDIAIEGDHAYLACEYDGLQVVDISDLSNPVMVGSADTPEWAFGVDVAGDLAYVTDMAVTGGEGGVVTAFDVTDPTNPVFVGEHLTDSKAYDVVIWDDFAFVTLRDAGFGVLRAFDRSADEEADLAQSLVLDSGDETITRARVTATETGTVAWQLSADGGTHWEWGAVVPDSLGHVFEYPGTDLLWRATLVSTGYGSNPTCSHLVIEWEDEGTGIEDPGVPAALALLPNTPNPVRSTTTFAYDVPAGAGRLRLEILDIAGRHVRTLVNGGVSPGRKTAVWDGRDARGNRVASGVYFLKAESDGRTLERKFVVVR